jgi:hypothetical protein
MSWAFHRWRLPAPADMACRPWLLQMGERHEKNLVDVGRGRWTTSA